MTKPSLTIRRFYEAPPDKVFRAWTDPQTMKRWFAPSDDFQVPEVEAEVRVGGKYRIVMRAPDGERHCVGGVYREVVPGKRLVFTWAWESAREREAGAPLAGMRPRRARRTRTAAGWSGQARKQSTARD